MNTQGFSDEQKSALIDLLVLGMYQDSHIASAEDKRLKTLLDSFDLDSDYARQQFADASFARISRHQNTPEGARSAASDCSAKFKDDKQRQQAVNALAELLVSDNRITPEENQFLMMIQEVFGLKKQ